MENIFKVIKISRPFHKRFALIAFLILLLSIVQQLAPILSKFVVDEIQKQVVTGTGDLGRVFGIIALSAFAIATSTLLDSVNARLGDSVSSRLRSYLTNEFYTKIFTLSQEYFDGEISGKIVNQLNRGIDSIKNFINGTTNFILPAFVQSILALIVLAYYDWVLALTALTIFPVYTWLSYISTKRWGKHELKKNKLEDETRGRIHEVIANMKLVRASLTQRIELDYVLGRLSKIIKIFDKQSLEYHLLNFGREMFLEASIFVIGGIVFYKTFRSQITLGEMVLILQVLNLLRRPLFAMSYILERIQEAETGAREYFEIMDLESKEEIVDVAPSVQKPSQVSIMFKNVSFAYKEGKDVLKNIDATFSPGEKIAVVGHSGAGKTTLINLILKFYDPTSGEIYFGNERYIAMKHSEIRRNISLVFQDSELFADSVKENVAYGCGSVSNEEIIKALKLANADEFVMSFPKGLDTQIGERGVRLSGGQKQRIQIARAILQDRPILILDEATSSLDAKSEKLVQEGINYLIQDRLVIIIAHRFSTIQNVNKIIVLDAGRLVDSGTPSQLAKREGLYAELLQYQIEGNKKLLSEFEIY